MHYFTTDHLGSVRLVTDPDGNILEQFDYLPYGQKCNNSSLAVANQRKTDYLYTGKELSEAFFGIDWYDSVARFQTSSGVFTSPDPLAEKYYSVSPYAYCAGNPVRFVDNNGGMWYSYENDNGQKQYIYYEEELTQEEQDIKGYSKEGLTYENNGFYYSLFGLTMDDHSPETKLYKVLDKMIIRHMTDREDLDCMINKTNLFIEGFPKQAIAFSYRGLTFSSIFGSTSGKNIGDGSIFYACEEKNSSSFITHFPTDNITLSYYSKKLSGYWLIANNGKGSYNGFCTVQIKFDKANASAFMNSLNKLFHSNIQIR